MTYGPHDFQKVFHRSDSRFRGLWWGRRAGKSLSGEVEDVYYTDRGRSKCCYKIVRYTEDKAYCTECGKETIPFLPVGMIVEPRYEDFENIVLPIITSLLGPPSPQTWQYFGSKHVMEFYRWAGQKYTPGVPKIVCGSADYPDRLGHGQQFDFVHFDETRDHKNFTLGFETMYPALTDRRGDFWSTTSINGPDEALVYFKERSGVVTRAKDMTAMTPQPPVTKHIDGKSEEYHMIYARSIDNPYLDMDVITEAKKTMTPMMFRQEYMASEEQFRGLVYPDYISKKHFIPSKELDGPLWFIGIDVGWNHPTGIVLMAEDIEHKLYVIDEFKESHQTPKQVVDAVHSLLLRNNLKVGDIELFVYDTSANQVQQASGTSVYEQMMDPDVVGEGRELPLVKANKDFMAGFTRLTALIRTGGFNVYDRCVQTDAEMKAYRWPDKLSTITGNNELRPIKKFDDLIDPVRYVVVSRPDWYERPQKDWYGRTVNQTDGEETDFFEGGEWKPM